jgi:two-component system LytT family sensor kinase
MGHFYPFIFSNNARYRLSRHIIFWLLWISFYAFVQAYRAYTMWHASFLHSFPLSLGEMFIQIPIDIAFCYSVIYFLLPRYFLKGKYFSFLFGWLVLVFAFSALENRYFMIAVPWYRNLVGLKPPMGDSYFLVSVLMIVGSLNTEGGFAIAVKFGKMFIIKQKEAELLFQEKEQMNMNATLNDDSGVQSTFLSNVLSRLYNLSQQKQVNVASSIHKINNLVLYAGYRSKQNSLPLQKELEAFKEYIDLQAISYDHSIDVKYSVKGNTANKQLAYFILMPLVESSFNSIGNGTVDKHFVNVHISIEASLLNVTIESSKSSDTSTLLNEKNINFINIEKRLRLLYPDNYKLKKIIQPDSLTIQLKINLDKKLSI